VVETKKISLRRDTADKIAKLGDSNDTYESIIKRLLDFYIANHPTGAAPAISVTQPPDNSVTKLQAAQATTKICRDFNKEKSFAEHFLGLGDRPKAICKACLEERERKPRAKGSKK
jgi:hypothetical protein